ncbi:asparagine synthase-related protein [Streptomyces sp. DH37]|uniref:asparagine synthase-related protein n=1 Tax=Streptomyces sp. DH37 TaxID=3040122 RepID=UPI002441AD1A|nr:asparagine synthase-related protein [Streptomyces sp. DH37]MDG9702089.1 asparagine synthase-related protein [Streptomyces sp. DH37]
MPGHLRDFFAVLPDTAEGQAVAGRLRSEAEDLRAVLHPSGRPWIVHRLPFRQVSRATRGGDSLVLIGPAGVPGTVLSGILDPARDTADLHRRLARLPGIHHVVSRLDGEVCVRGTASGHRRVYHARYAGGRLVSDRPAVLAHLTGAGIDDGALALRLLDTVPHPLRHRPVWGGLEEVDPAYALSLRAGGPGHTVWRWWHPPEPELGADRGAPLLAAALADSVRAHLAGHTRISCELSGGLDSTSVAFLARQAGDRETVLLTAAARDAHAEDEMWARRGAEDARRGAARTVEHRVVPAGDVPLFYADLRGNARELLDEPFPVAPARARAELLIARAAAAGSRYHLTGYGGDELFNGLPAACQDLLPGSPLKAWSRIGALRHQLGWPLWPTLRGLLARPSFAGWLAGAVTPEPPSDGRVPLLSWGMRQTMRPWFTEDARALILGEFRSAAEHAEPLSPRPGRHMDIDTVRLGARVFQSLEDVGVTVGLPVAAPFYDDRVVEAVLSVRVEDRVVPWRYKPLLVEAMREVVPARLLARTTKDHMAADDVQGLREHSADLRALWSGSLLARRGLVDAGRLERLADDPFSPVLQRHPIDSTVSCETWLRTAEDAWPADRPTGGNQRGSGKSERNEAVS